MWKTHKIISISKRKTTTVYRVAFLASLPTNSYDTHNLLRPTLEYREVPVNGTYGRWLNHKAKQDTDNNQIAKQDTDNN